MAKLEELSLGDLVYVNRYTYLSPREQRNYVEGPGSRVTGYVNSFYAAKEDWRTSSQIEILVPFKPATATKWTEDTRYWVHQEHLTILAKGTRKVIPGIDIPMSPALQLQIEYGQWEYRIRKLDLTHQGFSNLPTFLAWLYIHNDRPALEYCRSQRRKDGTINPDKVHKAFYRYGLRIDEDSFELPIDLPEHIQAVWFSAKYKPKVNWTEVAANI